MGLSFRKTSDVIRQHKDAFGNGKTAGLNDQEVRKMVRVNVGANLQIVSNVLNPDEVWNFSLSGYGRTHKEVSFSDVHIRVCFISRLFSIHLIVVPLWDRYTAMNI